MKKIEEQSGIALLSTLLLLAGLGVLVGMAVVFSRYSTDELTMTTRRGREQLIAESALNRAVFWLRRDIAENIVRRLGEFDYRSNRGRDRWLADGIDRELELYDDRIRIRLLDAFAGEELTAATVETRLPELVFDDRRRPPTVTASHRLERVVERLKDYIDADSAVSFDGMEARQYRDSNRAALPRNAMPQLKEEWLWIDGMREFFPPDADGRFPWFLTLPPLGLPPITGGPAEGEEAAKKNLFATPLAYIRRECDLDDREYAEVAAALERWRTERQLLSDTLKPELLRRLDEVFSRTESGFYQMELTVGEPGGLQTRLLVIFQLARTSGDNLMRYYEYLFF